jgi:PAS domain S-box-containing protein
VIRCTGIASDITERKQAEEKLRQQSALINSLLDSIPDVVFYKDLNGVYLGCNPALAEFIEKPREAIVGKTDHELFDRATADFFRENDKKMLATLEARQNEEWVTYPGGRKVLLHTLKTPYRGPDGQVIGVLGISRDITVRHLMEQALREREEQLVLFVEHSPAAIAMLNNEMSYIVASRRWIEDYRMGGQPPAGRNHYEIFPEIPQRWRDIYQRCLAGAVEKCDEEEFHRADGTSHWIRWEIRPWRHADGIIGGIILFSEDITTRRQAEQDLRESEARYRQLFELESNAVVLVDSETHRYVDVNLAAQALYGYTREEFLQLTPENISDEPEKTHDYIDVCNDHVPLRWHRKKSGERLAVEINANRIIYQGRRTALVSLRDVTERQRADAVLQKQLALQQQVTNIANTVPGVIYSFLLRPDGSNCFPYASQAIREQFGFDPEDLAKDGSPIFALMHPEDVGRVQTDIAESARTLKTWSGEFRYNHPTRGEIWISGRSEPQVQPDGSILWQGFTAEATERKRAELALIQNQQLLRTVIDLVPHFIFAKDNLGRFLFANEACATAYGLTPEQLVGRTTAEVMTNREQAEAFMRDDREVIASQRRKVISEERLTGSDGQARFLQTIKTPFVPPGHAEPAVVGVAVDITAQKNAADALRRSEERFRLLWQQSADGIRLTDAAGNVVMANAAYCQLMDLPPEAVEGHPMSDVYLAENQPKILEDHRANFATRNVKSRVETQVTLRNGNKLWLEVSNSFMEHPGAEPLLLAMFRDVTKRKQAEEQMKVQFSALTAAANAIVITDRAGIIEWVNPAFTQCTGYTPEEAVGQSPSILKSGQNSPSFYANLWATILTGNPWHGELVNCRKNGSEYHEEMTITPVKDAAGNINHFVAIKQNITERKQLSARLQQAEKMEAIGTLAGGIAHDFNNILAAMFGYGYLLQSDCEGNAAASESIAEILKAATRAKDLVQQILTFSRQREQKRQVVRLNTVVKEAMKFMRASLPAGIRIDMDLEEDAPPVLADPSQIYQVVLNLATNAFHAMEGLRGTLTVSLRQFTADEEFRREHPEITAAACVQLVIADTGHGMKPDVLAHIFEPFFTTKAVGKGTGLGLAVVHGIVKSHDGAIELESLAGQGTSFKIYFPARSEELVVTPVPSSQMPRGNGQRILVVDDEIAITGVLQKLLTRLNYHVTTADSPVAALEMFRRDPDAYALVITDLTMPDMDGCEFALQIHAQNPQIPIVLTSGHVTEISDERLAQSGIGAVLEKPVVNATLARLVERFLAPPAA